MNKFIAVFPNTHPTISGSICIAAHNIEADDKKQAAGMAAICVPLGWPIKVYEVDEYDKTFHNAYEPDWSIKDGIGTSEKIKKNFVLMGFTENW
jgi:hypothetical protein